MAPSFPTNIPRPARRRSRPQLSWTNAPPGTQSFALIVDDPDTALQHTTNEVLHWAAFNIPATVTSLPEGVPNASTLPDGTVQPLNTGKKNGFMGPGARGPSITTTPCSFMRWTPS